VETGGARKTGRICVWEIVTNQYSSAQVKALFQKGSQFIMGLATRRGVSFSGDTKPAKAITASQAVPNAIGPGFGTRIRAPIDGQIIVKQGHGSRTHKSGI
jgi:hypothetical protein